MRKLSGRLVDAFFFSFSGPIGRNMSECMSVTRRSGRPSLSKSKNLIPMAPHGGSGEVLPGLFHKLPAALVFKVVVSAHHVQKVDIGPAVAVQIGETRISGPSIRQQPHAGGHIFESVLPQIPIEHGVLITLRIHVALEGVRAGPRIRHGRLCHCSCSGPHCRPGDPPGRHGRSRQTRARGMRGQTTLASGVTSRTFP